MKACILAFVSILFLFSLRVHGQATFLLSNRELGNELDAPIFDAQGVPLEGTNYLAELYGNLTPDKLAPAAISKDQPTVRVIVPFRVQGYIGSRAVTILGTSPAAPAWLQLRVWRADLGATYEEAVARGIGGYGESFMFYALGGGDTGGVPVTPGLLSGLQSFRLRPMVAVLMYDARLQGNQVIIEWNARFPRYQLQQSLVLGQAWENLGEPTTATAYTNQLGPGTKFYRVIALLD